MMKALLLLNAFILNNITFLNENVYLFGYLKGILMPLKQPFMRKSFYLDLLLNIL